MQGWLPINNIPIFYCLQSAQAEGGQDLVCINWASACFSAHPGQPTWPSLFWQRWKLKLTLPHPLLRHWKPGVHQVLQWLTNSGKLISGHVRSQIPGTMPLIPLAANHSLTSRSHPWLNYRDCQRTLQSPPITGMTRLFTSLIHSDDHRNLE